MVGAFSKDRFKVRGGVLKTQFLFSPVQAGTNLITETTRDSIEALASNI
jgi:hypothetical protein